jgi:hypothetical protein
MGEKRNAYRILVGKPEGKRSLERPRRRWEDNVKMDLIDIGSVGLDWIDLAQDTDQWMAVVNTVMNLRVPQNVGKFLSSCTTGGFSRRAQLHEVSLVTYGFTKTRPTTTNSSHISTMFLLMRVLKDNLIPSTSESRLSELISDKYGSDNCIKFLFTEQTLYNTIIMYCTVNSNKKQKAFKKDET